MVLFLRFSWQNVGFLRRHGSLPLAPAKLRWLSSARESAREQQPMKPTQINDPFHNPFHNRFNVPVHSRLDEMQAYTHMIWLNEPAPSDRQPEQDHGARGWGRALAGAFALVLV